MLPTRVRQTKRGAGTAQLRSRREVRMYGRAVSLQAGGEQQFRTQFAVNAPSPPFALHRAFRPTNCFRGILTNGATFSCNFVVVV